MQNIFLFSVKNELIDPENVKKNNLMGKYDKIGGK